MAETTTELPAPEYDSGMDTTPGMWEFLSEQLEGEALPEPLNRALYARCARAARSCS